MGKRDEAMSVDSWEIADEITEHGGGLLKLGHEFAAELAGRMAVAVLLRYLGGNGLLPA
jgi:hypothetical protein